MFRLRIASIGVGLILTACATESSATPSGSEPDYLAYAERIELVVACVEEHGFEASSYQGFGVQVEYSGADQGELASRVEGECWEEVAQRFPEPPPLSLEATYHYLLDVADCLRGLGHEVADAPSLDAYLDQAAAQQPTWDPYAILAERGVDTWEIQREVCPPAPWAR
jgi:hypothetical protein